MAPCRALVLAPCLLLTGCCSLARLFCGPDDSRWVSVSYDSPTKTVETLLEAIRRDAPEVIYTCLSRQYRRSLGIDSLIFQVAWEKLKEQVTGIHLAGYAQVPRPNRQADNGATFVLDVEGYKLEVDVVRLSYRQIVYDRPGDAPPGESKVTLGSWNDLARVELIDDAEFDRSRLTIEPLAFEHEGLDAVPLTAIQRAGLIREWKISSLRTIE